MACVFPVPGLRRRRGPRADLESETGNLIPDTFVQPSRAAADRDPIPVSWGLLPWSRTLTRLQLLDRVAAPLQAGRKRAVVSAGVLLRGGLLLLRLLPLVAIGAALTGATGHGTQLGATFHGVVGAAVLGDVADHLPRSRTAYRTGSPLADPGRGRRGLRRRRCGIVAGLARGLGGTLLLVGGSLLRRLALQRNHGSRLGHSGAGREQAQHTGPHHRPAKPDGGDGSPFSEVHARSPLTRSAGGCRARPIVPDLRQWRPHFPQAPVRPRF